MDSSLREFVDVAALCAVLKSQNQIDDFARRLVTLARRARVKRNKDNVNSLSRVILELPANEKVRNAGLYYSAFSLKSDRRFNDAERTVLQALENLEPSYVPRALLEVASLRFDAGDLREADGLYDLAARMAAPSDPLTFYQSCRMRSVIRAIEGDHQGALNDFRSLWPLARTLASPGLEQGLLNSIALELGEIGRVEEATRIIDPLVSSPLAASFPEWHLTKADLAVMPRRAFPPFTLALGTPALSIEAVKSLNSIVEVAESATELESETACVQSNVEQHSPESARDARPTTDLSRRSRPAPRML
ncbi:MAG: hypothetical protein ACREAC_18805, partial [Blastocatellia bacterium]